MKQWLRERVTILRDVNTACHVYRCVRSSLPVIVQPTISLRPSDTVTNRFTPKNISEPVEDKLS